MSIATKRGDTGQTGLPGGIRVSKADRRVDAYGTIDELISAMGFARSICPDEELRALTKELQRELFKVGSAIATPAESKKPVPEIGQDMVDRLTSEVHRIEAIEGVLGDWAIPGEDPCSSAFDVARTVCRRAERLVVELIEQGIPIQPAALAYINRLSDLLWLFGRLVESRLGLDATLRTNTGPRWSRAW
ncbi:MAG: cob(I)yrinic acid a,c-diamide adenosyltransferase [Bryobacteraceae bacterium]|nr:cob(I)yrinic acid a,c-diamide adenosyltransferase [Bryobacteraceae bacterium]